MIGVRDRGIASEVVLRLLDGLYGEKSKPPSSRDGEFEADVPRERNGRIGRVSSSDSMVLLRNLSRVLERESSVLARERLALVGCGALASWSAHGCRRS